MRIAVTGMGLVSSLGRDVETFRDALWRGDCGIVDLTRFDTGGFAFTRAGEVRDFAFEGDRDPGTQFMAAAARDAWATAFPGKAPADGAVVLGTNFGGAASGEALLEAAAAGEPAAFAAGREYFFQTAADHVARELGLSGPRAVLSLSCASGAAAMVYARDLLRHGRARAVLAGGYDALSAFAWSGLSALRTMTRDCVRPFDRNRKGTIFSEGAGALVLEPLDAARARGASILAELAGAAWNNNAHHMTAPAPAGAGTAAVMREALADAGLAPDTVDHINAHGTGTRHNDVTETQAIRAVFGDAAEGLAVTAVKSMTGHLMGAAGSVEAIASVLTLRDGFIPPTIHFETPDPECDLDVVFNEGRAAAVRTVLSNSAGIGGCNAAVILRAPGEAVS